MNLYAGTNMWAAAGTFAMLLIDWQRKNPGRMRRGP